MKRAVQAFARGFAAGYGLKVVVEAARHLLAALRLLLRRSVATVSVNGMTPALSQLLLNALLSARNARFGLFLGGALGTYRAVLALLQWRCRVAGNAELQPLHVVMAGSVAALAIVVDSGPEAFDRRRTLTLYAAAKSLQYLCQVLVARGTLPKIPSLPGWLFTIACGQIMFAWFYHPHTLPRSYRHWISLMANMDQGTILHAACLLVGEVSCTEFRLVHPTNALFVCVSTWQVFARHYAMCTSEKLPTEHAPGSTTTCLPTSPATNSRI